MLYCCQEVYILLIAFASYEKLGMSLTIQTFIE